MKVSTLKGAAETPIPTGFGIALLKPRASWILLKKISKKIDDFRYLLVQNLPQDDFVS